jgi:hypothetical protein
MNRHKKQQISPNAYMAKKEFRDHLEKRLQHEKLYQKKKLAGEELTKEEQKERDDLHRMKLYYLDKCVFPSMANVVTFLEYCMHSPLQEIFEDDIEELLLGIRQEHYEKKLNDYSNYENRTVIARFLIAILSWNSTKHPESFRLKLFPIIQRAITFRILGITPEILGNRMYESIVVNDFARAGALAEFIGKGIKIKTDMPNRPVKF